MGTYSLKFWQYQGLLKENTATKFFMYFQTRFFLFPPDFQSFHRDCWGGWIVTRYWETTLDQKEKEKVGVMQSCICNNTSHVATVCSSATYVLHPCLFTAGEISLFFSKTPQWVHKTCQIAIKSFYYFTIYFLKNIEIGNRKFLRYKNFNGA